MTPHALAWIRYAHHHTQPRPNDLRCTILRLAAAGHTNVEIAIGVKKSPATVEYHLNELYMRYQWRNKAQAVAEALRRGWIE